METSTTYPKIEIISQIRLHPPQENPTISRLHGLLRRSSAEGASGKVPLYSGSDIYIAMEDLVKIYSPNPALYTARLLDIIFGREILVGACTKRLVDDDDDLKQLDSHKLRSVIGSSKLRAAKFGYTQKGRAMLLYNGYAYIKDRQAQKSCNWKCSLFGKLKCRARAVTKEVNGRQMMKITKPLHNHTRDVYSFDKCKKSKE